MRTYSDPVARPAQASGGRSLADIFADAVATLRQDGSEFGFVALLGGFTASFTTLILRLAGGALPLSIIGPFILLTTVVTMATSCAMVRRVDDNLQPDSARAFTAVIIRSPAIVLPLLPALILLGLAVFAATLLDGHIGGLGAGGVAFVLGAFALHWTFKRSVYIAALFTRNTTVKEAWAASTAVLRSAPFTILITLVIALAPGVIFTLGAALAGFGTVSTAIAAFFLAFCAPLAGTMMFLLYQQASEGSTITPSAPRAPRPSATAAALEDRIHRHMR